MRTTSRHQTDFTRQTITHKIIRSDAHHQGVILVLIESRNEIVLVFDSPLTGLRRDLDLVCIHCELYNLG